MPGPVNYVTDAITEGRRHNLDAYVKNLLAQPPYISRCNLVRQFFAPGEVITRSTQTPSVTSTVCLGDLSGHLLTPCRWSIPTVLEAKPQRKWILGTVRTNATNDGQQWPATNGSPTVVPFPAISNILSPGIQQAGAQMKVKLSYNGDIIAIKVPSDIAFRGLYDRILERLRIPQGRAGAVVLQGRVLWRKATVDERYTARRCVGTQREAVDLCRIRHYGSTI